MTKRETFVDKGLDVLLVVASILMALSIDSCREDYQTRSQWKNYAKQIYQDAQLSGKKNQELIQLFKSQYEGVKQARKKLDQKTLTLKELESTLQQSNYFDASFPNVVLYEALMSSGNHFFLDNVQLVSLVADYFSFKDKVQYKVTYYDRHVVPDVKKMYLHFYKNPENSLKDFFTWRFYLITIEVNSHLNLEAYQEQEAARKKLIQYLKPFID